MASPIKKGNISWRPAARLSLVHKKPGFVYRWCDKDKFNIEKKLADGWGFASGLAGTEAQNDAPPSGSICEYRELVLMAIPEDEYKAHREYFQELTRKQTVGLKQSLAAEISTAAAQNRAPVAPIHGKIVTEIT